MQTAQRRGMYYDTLDTAINEAISIANKKSDEFIDINTVAEETLGSFWDILKLILKTIHHSSEEMEISYEDENEHGNYLHATCSLIGPSLPRPVFRLIFTFFKHQVKKLDSFGRVPLHYACASFSTHQDLSLTPISKSFGWYEMDNTSQPLDLMKECIIEQLLSQDQAFTRDRNGLLPLHFAIESEKSSKVLEAHMDAYKLWRSKREIGHCVIDWTSFVKRVAKAYPDVLGMIVPKAGLYPFMMAACNPMGNSIEIVYCLLKMVPTTAYQNQSK